MSDGKIDFDALLNGLEMPVLTRQDTCALFEMADALVRNTNVLAVALQESLARQAFGEPDDQSAEEIRDMVRELELALPHLKAARRITTYVSMLES